MLKHTGIGLISASLLLAGCGGGSSSTATTTYDGPTAVVVIDESNADTIAGMAVSQLTSNALDDSLSFIGVASSSTENTTLPLSLTTLNKLAKKYADLALSTSTDTQTLAGVTDTYQEPCSGGGTITFTETVKNPYAYEPTVGDSFSMTFNNCVDYEGEINGSISAVLNAWTSDYDYSATMTFSRFKMTDSSTGNYGLIDGGLKGTFHGDGFTIPVSSSLTGSALYFEAKAANQIHNALWTNFSFVTSEDYSGSRTIDHDFTIASTEIGGSISVKTTQPFTFTYSWDLYPTSGQMVVIGANNAAVMLTANNNDTVTVDYDLNGNTLYGTDDLEYTEPLTKTLFWYEL